MVNSMEPRIIPYKEHPISRKQVSPNALRTLYRLHNHGFIAYLVGGCVRDLLMDRVPKDFDIATNARPGQIRRLFRNCFLVGRRFRLAHLHFQDETLEVSTFRRAALPSDNPGTEEMGPDRLPLRHIKDEDGMVLLDNLFGTPEEDALCRDFTINALAYNIADASVIDYSSGLIDLEQRLIRPIGDPYVRFTEDPVRMLRAVRFSASHSLVIETAAWDALCQLSSTISRISPSRLYEEIQKLFLQGYARPSFSLLDKSGLLGALFPMLNRWIYGRSHGLTLVYSNLEYFDQLVRDGSPLSPALFLASLFGPSLEEAAIARHRDGIPHQQALEGTCVDFMKEIRKTACIPGQIGNHLRALLALQPSLHRMPPRRPHSIIRRPEFSDALAYLRLAAETRKEAKTPLEWWNTFLSKVPPETFSEPAINEIAPTKKRRKRRRRHRHASQNAP